MKKILIVILFLLFIFSCLPPEGSSKYIFGGYIFDSITSDPIENVEVSPGLGQEEIIFTNEYGYFETTIELGGYYDIYDGKFGFSLWKNGYILGNITVYFNQTDAVAYLDPSGHYIMNGQIVDNTTDTGLYSSLNFSFDKEIKNLKTIDLTTDIYGKFVLDFFDNEFYYLITLKIVSEGYIDKTIFIDNMTPPDNWIYEYDGPLNIYKYDYGKISLDQNSN